MLFRKWKNRVKGRDWYDLEWYVKNAVPINLSHFCLRANESGDWQQDSISKDQLISLVNQKIESVNFKHIKDDIIRFIPNPEVLEIWSASYFKQLVANNMTHSTGSDYRSLG